MPSQIKVFPTSIQVPADGDKYRRSSLSTNKNEPKDVPTKVNGHIDDDDISSLGAPSTINVVPLRQTKKKTPSSQNSNQRNLRRECDDDKDMMQRTLDAEMVNIKLAKLLRESKKAAENAASQVRSLEEKNRALSDEIEEKVEEVKLLEQQLDNEQVRRLSVSGVEASLRIRIAELEAENLRLREKKPTGAHRNMTALPASGVSSGGSSGSTATENTVSIRTTDSSEEDQKNDILVSRRRQSNSRLDRRVSETSLNGSTGTLGSIFEDEDICGVHDCEVEDHEKQVCEPQQVDCLITRRGSSSDILTRSFMRQSAIPGRRQSFTKRSSLPMVEMNPSSLEKNNASTSRRAPICSTNKTGHFTPAESGGTRRSSLPQDLM